MSATIPLRFCPLCAQGMNRTYCAKHFTPTLRPRRASEPSASIVPGTILGGRYQVERLLGRGGMSTVLAARQLGAGHQVVVKLLAGELAGDAGAVRRFYREAQLASSLRHPNIVRIFDLGADDAVGKPFIVMEHLNGETLRELIDREGAIEERRAAMLLAQVARALLEAHRAGIVHRDLKPSNIMIDALASGEEHATVLDFGLAKRMCGVDPALTEPGLSLGTPSFMAPEQALQAPQDFRTDLYSLGCILHLLLTGSRPFASNSPYEEMARHVRETPPRLPRRLPSGAAPSREVGVLRDRLLAKEPVDRPSCTEEVVQILAAIAGSPPAGRPSRRPPPEAATEVDGSLQVLRTMIIEPRAARAPESPTRTWACGG